MGRVTFVLKSDGHRAIKIGLQKKRPKSLKTLARAQNCTPSVPSAVKRRLSAKPGTGKVTGIHVFPPERFA
jgi:hypothetical protein